MWPRAAWDVPPDSAGEDEADDFGDESDLPPDGAGIEFADMMMSLKIRGEFQLAMCAFSVMLGWRASQDQLLTCRVAPMHQQGTFKAIWTL